MTLQLLHSEFSLNMRNIFISFYQCGGDADVDADAQLPADVDDNHAGCGC
jgi:hypothetical protein